MRQKSAMMAWNVRVAKVGDSRERLSEAHLAIFREQVPMGERTYRTFRWGKFLQVWLTDGRDFRSSNNMPDGPDKTTLSRRKCAACHHDVRACSRIQVDWRFRHAL